MFKDMGTLAQNGYDTLFEASRRYFDQAMSDGRYVAWFVCVGEDIVAGGGMQINTIPPRPGPDGLMMRPGPQGLIINVYVEEEWRRKGIASLLMRHMIDFARKTGIPSLTLHASEAGKPLYEQLGFAPTGEMRLLT
jgi:GNAT superfamily N-acetyltransferase